MKGFLLTLTCLLCIAPQAHAAPPIAQERVIELPQDQDKVYLTVFGDERDARYRAIKNWFDSSPELRQLRDETHYNTLDVRSPVFRERFAASTPNALHLRLQTGDDLYCDVFSGEVPGNAEGLLGVLRNRLFRLRCLKDRLTPQPSPTPQPTQPSKDPDPQPLSPPKQKPEQQPEQQRSWRVMFAFAVASGVGVGLLTTYRGTHTRA